MGGEVMKNLKNFLAVGLTVFFYGSAFAEDTTTTDEAKMNKAVPIVKSKAKAKVIKKAEPVIQKQKDAPVVAMQDKNLQDKNVQIKVQAKAKAKAVQKGKFQKEGPERAPESLRRARSNGARSHPYRLSSSPGQRAF